VTRGHGRLRRAVVGDAACLAELWLSARRGARGIPPPVHDDEQIRAWFREAVASSEVWVVTDERGRPGGVMMLDGESVEQLYVLPDQQGRGFGSALLEHAQATRDSLALWTFEANAAARSFYEARGFVRDGGPTSENEERAPAVRYRWSRPDPRAAGSA
jgi:GNAT superfamily N-acetyltransferase